MNSHAVPQLTVQNFDTEVLGAHVPVLVDFTAPWCSPCRALEPILCELQAESGDRRRIVCVDGDASPELAARFGVKGFPTLLLFVGGKEVARQIGLTTKRKLLQLLAAHEAAA